MQTLINYAGQILFSNHLFYAFIFIGFLQVLEVSGQRISHDKDHGVVIIQSDKGQLMFRLKYNDGCYFDRVEVRGQQVISTEKGVSSAIKVNGKWYSSRDKNKQPIVKVNGNSVSIEQIRYGTDDFYVEESWYITAMDDVIEWQIQRETKGIDALEDDASVEWVFPNMQMWTGALLDNGSVAWNRLLEDKKNDVWFSCREGVVLE